MTAIACSEPPEGNRWTMELLGKRLVEDGVVTTISPVNGALNLKKRSSSPGKSEAGASPR